MNFRRLRRCLDTLYLASAFAAALCLVCIALLILAQVAGRWFSVLVPAAEEFAGYLMAAATFLALAWTLRNSGHIRVTILIRFLPARARVVQEALVLLFATLLAACIAWAAIELVIESWQFQDVSAGYLAVPLWIPQLPMAIGLVIFAIALLDELLAVLAGKAPLYVADDATTLKQADAE